MRGDFLPFFCGAGFPGRSCQADGAQCGLPLLGGRAGFSWVGSRGRTRSHEPLQWALQGVFGAPLPPGGCLAPWGADGVSLGVRGVGSPSRTCLPTSPSLPPPAPCRFIVIWGEDRGRNWPRGGLYLPPLSRGRRGQLFAILTTDWVVSMVRLSS